MPALALALAGVLLVHLFPVQILAYSHEEGRGQGIMTAEVLASGALIHTGELRELHLPSASVANGLVRREPGSARAGGESVEAAGAAAGAAEAAEEARPDRRLVDANNAGGTGAEQSGRELPHPMVQLEGGGDAEAAARGRQGEIPAIFNCSEGLGAWERGWSQAKKEWCCRHSGVACPPKERADPEEESEEAQEHHEHQEPHGQQFSGQEMCEGHGFSEVACLSLGCCHFDSSTSLCYSAVAHHACTLPASGEVAGAQHWEVPRPGLHTPPIMVVPELAPAQAPAPAPALVPVLVPAPAPTLAPLLAVPMPPHLQVVGQAIPSPAPAPRAPLPVPAHIRVVRPVPGQGPVVRPLADHLGGAPTLPQLPGLASTKPPPPVLPPGTTQDDERVIEAASQAAVDEENREALTSSGGTTSTPIPDSGKKGKKIALIVGLSIGGVLLLLLLLAGLMALLKARSKDGAKELAEEDSPTAQAPEAASGREDEPHRVSRAGLQF